MINSPGSRISAVKFFLFINTFLVFAVIAPSDIRAQPPDPISYSLRFPAPHTHYVTVEAMVPTDKRPRIEMMMAVWTPGSYLVREFERNVEDLKARTFEGKPLDVHKTLKNRWVFETGGSPSIIISYRVYCHEMSVRTNWVDAGFALLNGAPTFMTLVEDGKRPHDVQVYLPPGWTQSLTGLPEMPGGGVNHYIAKDFDTLVDSPIVAGNPAVYEFEVAGKKHFLVNVGEGGVWDGPRSAKDVEKIVRENLKLWGFLPYDKYLFLNMIVESGGGLEHKNSTVMMTSRWATRTERRYKGWLGLVSHEYFHAWNVKRLRPVELGPFNYETEVYTKSLWIAEGITSYYGELLLRRAGLITQDDYLEGLSNDVAQLQNTPGRLVQPVEMASYDAWIKAYRPDENSTNTEISYYTKGSVLGFLLDARIRHATNGAKSLDDVMRLAYQRYSGEHGYTPQDFQKTASEVAGTDLSSWFKKSLETTEELDYTEALDWFGLEFKNPSETKKQEAAGKEEPAENNAPEKKGKAWLGVNTRVNDGRIVVTQIRRETPAYDAGFNVDDEILAVDDYRVTASQWPSRLEQYKPGDKISVLVARRDLLMRIETTLGTEPLNQWKLQVKPKATDADKMHSKGWLGA